MKLLRYRDTKRGQDLESKGHKLAHSEQTQKIKKETEQVLKEFKQEIEIGDQSIKIDNKKLTKIAEQAETINKDYENLKKSKEFGDFKANLKEERENNEKVKEIE